MTAQLKQYVHRASSFRSLSGSQSAVHAFPIIAFFHMNPISQKILPQSQANGPMEPAL